MEVFQCERGARSFRRVGPPPLNLELPDHVSEGLARPRDVAVDFDLGVGFRRAALHHLLDGSITVPPECVDSRVHDEPARPESLGLEHAEALVVVLEQPHLLGQPLAVQSPSLHERVAHQEAPEPPQRQSIRELHLDGDLEVMARVGLVEARGGCLVQIPVRQMAGIDVIHPWPGAVGGARLIEGPRHVVLPELFDLANLAVLLGEAAEVAGRQAPGRAPDQDRAAWNRSVPPGRPALHEVVGDAKTAWIDAKLPRLDLGQSCGRERGPQEESWRSPQGLGCALRRPLVSPRK